MLPQAACQGKNKEGMRRKTEGSDFDRWTCSVVKMKKSSWRASRTVLTFLWVYMGRNPLLGFRWLIP